MSPREKQIFEQQAEAEGLSLSVWIRTHLLAIAAKSPSKKRRPGKKPA